MKAWSAFFLLFIFHPAIASSDIIDEVAAAFRSGNPKALSAYFSSTVELSVLGNEEIYSKAQAELILKDFFQKNTPKSVKIIHKVVSNAHYKFGVVLLSAAKENYRVSYELKNNSGKFSINQIRIEISKE